MRSRDRRTIQIPVEAQEASHLMQGFTIERSAALILNPDSGRPESASAVSIQIGGRWLLATAKHNIENLSQDTDIRICPRGVRFHPGIDFMARSHPRAGATASDVGWIEIDPEVAVAQNMKAIGLEQVACFEESSPRRFYYIQGFPSREVELANGAFDPLSMCLLLISVEPIGAGVGVAVEYPPQSTDDVGLELVHPGGFSGGGIWTCERVRVWPYLNLGTTKLVALIRDFCSATNRLQGVGMEHWLRLVACDFPDLDEEIEIHLGEKQNG